MDDSKEEDDKGDKEMEGEKSRQGGIINAKATKDKDDNILADERDGGEEVCNHCGAPIAHLSPWQDIADKGRDHNKDKEDDASDPEEFSWRFVRAVI